MNTKVGTVVVRAQDFQVAGRLHPDLELLIVFEVKTQLLLHLLGVNGVDLGELHVGVMKFQLSAAQVIIDHTLVQTLLLQLRLRLLKQVVVRVFFTRSMFRNVRNDV